MILCGFCTDLYSSSISSTSCGQPVLLPMRSISGLPQPANRLAFRKSLDMSWESRSVIIRIRYNMAIQVENIFYIYLNIMSPIFLSITRLVRSPVDTTVKKDFSYFNSL